MLRARSPGRTVVGCVDGSRYLPSVCDHAAWLADALDAGIELLHLDEPPAAGGRGLLGPVAALWRSVPRQDPVLHAAAARVLEAGADLKGLVSRHEPFPQGAIRHARRAGFLVLGRRGAGSTAYSAKLGGGIEPIVRHARPPICLTPKVYLPASRALVVVDETAPDPLLAEFVAGHPALDGLSLEVARFGGDPDGAPETPRAPPTGKTPPLASLVQAPTTVRARHADEAIAAFFAQNQCDLIVMPRAVLLAEDRHRALEKQLTALRIPILLPPRPHPSLGLLG